MRKTTDICPVNKFFVMSDLSNQYTLRGGMSRSKTNLHGLQALGRRKLGISRTWLLCVIGLALLAVWVITSILYKSLFIQEALVSSLIVGSLLFLRIMGGPKARY